MPYARPILHHLNEVKQLILRLSLSCCCCCCFVRFFRTLVTCICSVIYCRLLSNFTNAAYRRQSKHLHMWIPEWPKSVNRKLLSISSPTLTNFQFFLPAYSAKNSQWSGYWIYHHTLTALLQYLVKYKFSKISIIIINVLRVRKNV